MKNLPPLLMALILCIPSLASAQAPQPAPAGADQRLHRSEGVQIILETRRLTVADNFSERFATQDRTALRKELGNVGFFVVLDQQVGEFFVLAAIADTGSNDPSVNPTRTVTVRNGERHEWSPLRPGHSVEGNDAVQATVSDDGKAIRLRLTWAKAKDTAKTLPAMSAVVPGGAHLLIHTHDGLIRSLVVPAPTSILGQLQDKLLNRKPKTIVVTERGQGYLLVTPRIAPPGEDGA